jgi:hypothetical protein
MAREGEVPYQPRKHNGNNVRKTTIVGLIGT